VVNSSQLQEAKVVTDCFLVLFFVVGRSNQHSLRAKTMLGVKENIELGLVPAL
jgi:hypothetical protein